MSSNSKSPPNLLVVDNSFLPYKPKHKPSYKYTNILVFFSSLLFLLTSIFILFISIFKNLSFSSLFNSTIFWFFISNALIFIIAADYAIFSLSQHKSFDLYENYSQPNPQLAPFQLQSSSLVVFDEERENPDEKLQVVIQRRDFQPPVRSYRRSKSEKPERSMPKEISSKKMRSESSVVKYEAKELEEEEENDEFSKMTDEELNRRVEEFIQRFNTQIRLQTS